MSKPDNISRGQDNNYNKSTFLPSLLECVWDSQTQHNCTYVVHCKSILGIPPWEYLTIASNLIAERASMVGQTFMWLIPLCISIYVYSNNPAISRDFLEPFIL